MKKIIFFLMSFLCIVSSVNATTEKFYGGELIPGMFIRKIDEDGNITDKQGSFIRRVSDDAFSYCLEPFVGLIQGYDYQEYRDDVLDKLGISNEVWEDITLIAYYGYMYEGHTEDFWYYITQIMIWRKVAPNAQFYFTDTLGGNIDESLYVQEIKEIENLVKLHKVLPNIINQTLYYGDTLNIYDTNEVLKKFEVVNNSDIVNIDDNTLQIDATKVGSYKIDLVRKSTNYDDIPIVYIDDVSQNVLRVGMLPDITYQFNINIIPCKLIVQKKDMDTLENINKSNIKFLLYDSDNNLVSTSLTNEDGIATFNNLSIGTYYLKEDNNQVLPGYVVNDEVVEVNIDSEITNTNYYNEQVKGSIKIIKYQEVIDDNILVEKLAKDIEFGLYDSNKNLLCTNKTNELGEIIFTDLNIGKYYIKELSVRDEYIVNDDYIEVNVVLNELNEGSMEMVKVENELKKGSIKVIKYKELENKEIVFAKGIEIGLFDSDKNLISVSITNENGEVIFENLAIGKYYVKELSNLIEYEIDDNYYKIIVKEDLLEEVNIVNYLKKGKLLINKFGDDYKALEGTVFNVYNSDDELVFSGATNSKGMLEVNDLVLGSYYIVETKASSGYQILNDKIYFNILENEEVITINITNERISVKVPNTGMYLEEIILFIDKKRLKLA